MTFIPVVLRVYFVLCCVLLRFMTSDDVHPVVPKVYFVLLRDVSQCFVEVRFIATNGVVT